MHELSMEQVQQVSGGGPLGSTVGTVIGGMLGAVGAMAATGATGGAAAALAIGIVGMASRTGALIGSAIEDSFY